MENQSLFKEYKGVFVPTPEEVGGPTKSVGQEKIFAYSPFALQDAIGERSAKKAWIEYVKLRFTGIEAEDLVHKIISKARDMASIIAGANAEDLSLKDYPYNKSKRDTKNWKIEDLKNFYTKLIEIYHHSRMGGEELDTALEKLLLSI
jgi:hypothetical protein